MRRCPRFEYGAGAFTADYSSPPWLPRDMPIGGRRQSATGVPATYIVHRDRLLDITLRFDEAHWPDVSALVEFGQTGQAITFYPDADELTSFSVYLDDPAPGTAVTMTRNTFARVMELKLTLRSADGIPPWVGFFADDD